MASRCYSGFVLSVVIILVALEYSSAKCYEGKHGIEIKEESDSETGKDVFPQSDTKFLGGRKMLQGLDEKQVHTPGKDKQADLDSSFHELQTESKRVQAQNKGDMFKQKENRKSKESRVLNGINEQHQSQKFMGKDHYITSKNDESKAFLEAADEVANLMRKDYKGSDRPRRKPPINNHEPKD